MDEIEQNDFCGMQIQKDLFPKEYLKYKIDNLWKYDLSRWWRIIYSVVDGEVILVSLVLEWFDHKEYERRFKYNK